MANANKHSTCAPQPRTCERRTAGQINPCDVACQLDVTESSHAELDYEEHHTQNDSGFQSRKHKRKQREPRRISNSVMTHVVKVELDETEGPGQDAKGHQISRGSSQTETGYTESDEETDLITNRGGFRPISPTREGREVDPFQFHHQENEDEDDDVDMGLHESISGGSHGSPTSDDGGDVRSPSGRGSKKHQRSYKNLSRSRRIVANARERNRVHTISAAFEGLRRAVPSYSHNQKLSKLAILRIACSYILALARLADKDYTPDQRKLSFGECVDMCTNTLQSEGRSKRRKIPLD